LLVGELEEVLDGGQPVEGAVEGHLRIKTPQSITALHLGRVIAEFLAENPKLTMSLVTMDRSVNPIEESFDLAISAIASTYANVDEISLCSYNRVLCASPGYLEAHGTPRVPGDLIEHDCLTFTPAGRRWSFVSGGGVSNVEVHSKLDANDSLSILAATLRGVGVAIMPRFLARPHLQKGELTELMPANPVSSLDLKVMVPANKSKNPAVVALVEHLRKHLSPIPPWELG
jgi:DNA-binding transcriptional LysR family regulator